MKELERGAFVEALREADRICLTRYDLHRAIWEAGRAFEREHPDDDIEQEEQTAPIG